MSYFQQPETISSAPNTVDQPNTATAGGDKSAGYGSALAEDAGPPPPAYEPSVTTPPSNAQQVSVAPAGNDNTTTQAAATKEIQQRQPQQLVTPLHALTEAPAWIDCPFCKRRTRTRVAKQGGSQQVLASILCGLVCICLVCLPGLAGWYENAHIYCSKCGKQVAMIPHDGMIQVAPVGADNGLTPSRYAS